MFVLLPEEQRIRIYWKPPITLFDYRFLSIIQSNKRISRSRRMCRLYIGRTFRRGGDGRKSQPPSHTRRRVRFRSGRNSRPITANATSDLPAPSLPANTSFYHAWPAVSTRVSGRTLQRLRRFAATIIVVARSERYATVCDTNCTQLPFGFKRFLLPASV